MTSCCATSGSTSGLSSASASGGSGGSAGCAAKAMNPASAMRTRVGTVRVPSTGMAVNRASARRNGHSSGASHCSSCASVKVSMGRGARQPTAPGMPMSTARR